jgi:hypothetical protein
MPRLPNKASAKEAHEVIYFVCISFGDGTEVVGSSLFSDMGFQSVHTKFEEKLIDPVIIILENNFHYSRRAHVVGLKKVL